QRLRLHDEAASPPPAEVAAAGRAGPEVLERLAIQLERPLPEPDPSLAARIEQLEGSGAAAVVSRWHAPALALGGLTSAAGLAALLAGRVLAGAVALVIGLGAALAAALAGRATGGPRRGEVAQLAALRLRQQALTAEQSRVREAHQAAWEQL